MLGISDRPIVARPVVDMALVEARCLANTTTAMARNGVFATCPNYQTDGAQACVGCTKRDTEECSRHHRAFAAAAPGS